LVKLLAPMPVPSAEPDDAEPDDEPGDDEAEPDVSDDAELDADPDDADPDVPDEDPEDEAPDTADDAADDDVPDDDPLLDEEAALPPALPLLPQAASTMLAATSAATTAPLFLDTDPSPLTYPRRGVVAADRALPNVMRSATDTGDLGRMETGRHESRRL
jgi:hypothetical protein